MLAPTLAGIPGPAVPVLDVIALLPVLGMAAYFLVGRGPADA